MRIRLKKHSLPYKNPGSVFKLEIYDKKLKIQRLTQGVKIILLCDEML